MYLKRLTILLLIFMDKEDVFGVGSTLTSFIVLGNYSMGMQVTGKADFIAQYLESGDLYGMIVSIIKTMPGAPVIMVVVLLTMIAFYI